MGKPSNRNKNQEGYRVAEEIFLAATRENPITMKTIYSDPRFIATGSQNWIVNEIIKRYRKNENLLEFPISGPQKVAFCVGDKQEQNSKEGNDMKSAARLEAEKLFNPTSASYTPPANAALASNQPDENTTGAKVFLRKHRQIEVPQTLSETKANAELVDAGTTAEATTAKVAEPVSDAVVSTTSPVTQLPVKAKGKPGRKKRVDVSSLALISEQATKVATAATQAIPQAVSVPVYAQQDTQASIKHFELKIGPVEVSMDDSIATKENPNLKLIGITMGLIRMKIHLNGDDLSLFGFNMAQVS